MRTFQGDPKLYLSEDGADLDYRGGQPTMEQGCANVALISLFTGRGWCGNTLARSEREKIGSDYEDEFKNPITLKSLNLIRDAAEKALSAAGFSGVQAVVTNPYSDRIKVVVQVKDLLGDTPSYWGGRSLVGVDEEGVLLDALGVTVYTADGSKLRVKV